MSDRQRTMCDLMRQTNGKQHMGWIQGTGCAGRSTGTADSIHIQHDQHRLTFDELETEVCIVGKTIGTMIRSVWCMESLSEHGRSDNHAVRSLSAALSCMDAIALFVAYTKTYDAGNILSSGTTLSLLGSAVYKGADLYTFADI